MPNDPQTPSDLSESEPRGASAPSEPVASALASRHWWQSLAELERSSDATAPFATVDEFSDGPPLVIGMPRTGDPGTRRDFFKLMGLSATAAMTACHRAPEQNILPYTTKPDEVIPGVAAWYATACGACPARCGLLVKTRDGRPIKIEGNPSHPVSAGAVCAVGQASVLGLYDADRARVPSIDGHSATWTQVDARVRDGLARVKSAGRSIRLVVPWGLGPTEESALAQLCGAHDDTKHIDARLVRFDPMGEREATAEVYVALYGAGAFPEIRLDAADVIVGVGADFLGTWFAPAVHSRQYAAARNPARHPRMARHVQLESHLSLTGAAADERIILAPSALVSAMALVVGALAEDADTRADKESNPTIKAAAMVARSLMKEMATSKVAAANVDLPTSALLAVANELRVAGAKAVLVCGGDDRQVHLLAALGNALLGNLSSTVVISPTPTDGRTQLETLSYAAFRAELDAPKGKVGAGVGAVIFVGTNPALVDAGLAQALRGVDVTVSTADRLDETARACSVHAPEGHFLEAWIDHAPRPGVETMGQPCVAPLFDTRPRLASLLAWAGESQDSFRYFKSRWMKAIATGASSVSDGGAEASVNTWDAIVRDGVRITSPSLVSPSLALRSDLSAADLAHAFVQVSAVTVHAADAFELVLHESVALRDGAHANNGWLQELPDPITKVTWGNVAAMSPARARDMGLADGDVVEIKTAAGAIRLAVLAQPGTAPGVVAVAVGYGRAREAAGRNAAGHGVDAWSLVARAPAGDLWLQRAAIAATVSATGQKSPLAISQTHASQEGRELARQILTDDLQHPHHESEAHEESERRGRAHRAPRSGNGLWPTHTYAGHRWALAVDLNACTGCGACVVSCNAENNIPVVGAEEVRRRREMHWMRIDRYYGGTPEAPEVLHQPMMCQHCENAPCETVCPVLATVHSGEGLNQQIYNRCVGTRYCANNCPTKVRRFNWFDYPHGDSLQRMVLNPDVVVRSRGVMEKCSMCVHRIEEGRALANREARALVDGDIQTACQQSCPASAIVFGDANDAGSAVSRLTKSGRAYHILEEINVKPQV